MNAETRAKEIVYQLAGVVLSLPPTAVSVSIITAAIRQAENDKLEEAARVWDTKPHHWIGPAEVAALIRSLKSKD